ncbi:hypothetical protein SJ05684_c30670 [Sinorhizobium sojae CCBAU 05684]|uniref:Uncharacterized protein n=1 Tax=Sinorhizobium sojae CCBAU 05684 TaxID=716928 RepID=A0A249PEY1_9HYPH|nr:hypothetical protein SJ05684_c30670 [Sinorhizobium sojae CCBAU 05684]
MIAEANPLDAIERQVRSTGTDPEALNNAAINSIRALVTGDENEAEAARDNAAQALASARNIPVEEARAQVVQIEEQYTRAVERSKEEAIEVADAAASAVSTGALVAFLALVLGAVAGWFGGRSGVAHPVIVDRLLPGRLRL